MTGVYVIPGFLLVRFKEDDRLRELQVPMADSDMLIMAGALLQAAARMTRAQPALVEEARNGNAGSREN